MLMNNKFSNKNIQLYKMKCLNTRSTEYEEIKSYSFDRIEKNNFIKKKVSK